MKNKFAFIALSLAFIFTFSACGGSSNSSTGGNGNAGTSGEYEYKPSYQPVPSSYTDIYDNVNGQKFTGGVHKLDAPETSDYLVNNRSTDYVILLPEHPSSELTVTAYDLQDLLLEATGAKFNVVLENDVSVSSTTKVISLGDTVRATDNVLNNIFSLDLGVSGYIIKTVNKSIYIVGEYDYGVSFGAYCMLNILFNFDSFDDDFYYMEKADTVLLRNFDVKQLPDVGDYLIKTYNLVDEKGYRRMGMLDQAKLNVGPRDTGHSQTIYIDRETYNNPSDPEHYHPKWFGESSTQLCLSARGDAAEYDLLARTVADFAINSERGFKATNPKERFVFQFGQGDEYNWCSCSACKAAYNKYQSNSAVQIKFLNKVSEYIDAWMASDEGKPYARDYYIKFFAYQSTLAAPAKYNGATGQYEPVDSSVVCNKHVVCEYCPYQMDLQNSLYAPVNEAFLAGLYGWKACCPHLAYYGYPYNANAYWCYFDTYENIKDLYTFYANTNSAFFYEENNKRPAWTILRIYVESKLFWNVNQNLDDIINTFFVRYFGDAADIMLNVFYQQRALYNTNRAALTKFNSFYGETLNAKYWPKNLILNWYNMVNEALNSISYLKKVNSDEYNALYRKITTERISFEYMLIVLYEKELDADFVHSLKVQTKQDAELNNIKELKLGVGAYQLFSSWGV